MGLMDRFGAPVSHENQEDVDRFGEAAELMLGYAPDPLGIIKEVLENSPDFIMARCFLAGVYVTASDKRRRSLLQNQYDELLKYAAHANDRERQHIAAIDLWLKGEFYQSSQAYANILNDYPRDLVALQFGHQTDFLLGNASSMRDRPARILNHWSDVDPQYSYLLGMQAFGLEECGHYPQAQAMAERCVSLNTKDTWGVHALAHCFEMQGETSKGIKFMKQCETHWGRDTYMSIHNRWHFSLFHIERCEFDSALKMHDEHMAVKDKTELMDLHDSAALLWRLHLVNVDVGNRWEILADQYSKFIDQAYMAFTDIHAMMAFVGANRDLDAQAHIKILEHAAKQDSLSAEIIRLVGLPLVKGIYAFGQGNYKDAKLYLGSTRHNSHMIGGSIAQRDVINLTLLEASVRDNDKGFTEALLAERTLIKPHSPLINIFEQKIT